MITYNYHIENLIFCEMLLNFLRDYFSDSIAAISTGPSVFEFFILSAKRTVFPIHGEFMFSNMLQNCNQKKIHVATVHVDRSQFHNCFNGIYFNCIYVTNQNLCIF